jgi:hypothetical protein
MISPALFNFFVSDCPVLADLLTSYADNFNVLESDSDIPELSRRLQEGVAPISKWADRKRLTIAPAKSVVTLFTPWNKQANVQPDISINGVVVPLDRNPKILGVIFDTMFTFRLHVIAIVAKSSQRLNIMKAISGSS